MAPAGPAVLTAAVQGSPLLSKYGEQVDRDSAYERLAAKLRQAPAPVSPADQLDPTAEAPAPRKPRRRTTTPRAPKPERSTAEQVLGSPEFRQMARSAAAVVGREIARSIFGTARRRR
jgi:hypothetical protein